MNVPRSENVPDDPFARFAAPRALDPLGFVVSLLRSRGYSDDEIRSIAECRMLYDGPEWAQAWVAEMGWNPPPSKAPAPPPAWMGEGHRRWRTCYAGRD